MRYAILLAFLALGAAPLPTASQMLERRLPYDAATAALSHVRLLSRNDYPGEDEYRHLRKFDPARLTVFGFPVRSAGAMTADAISHGSLTLSATLDAPYARVRAAALASRGRAECASTEGPPGECLIEEREQDGWTVDFVMSNFDDGPTLSCVYTKRST
jgi:hypothetical protein